ncbi:MAG: site-2 protease family protein [Gemmatimonadetes bacterium]|nr:site-2 protease family protein [Gemmatimonadota bacterium]
MDLLLLLPVLLFSVVVHEYAHGWVALREGDSTAYMLGRLTLNPAPHIDPLGSLLFPLLLWVTHAGFLFGWARPVPVNPRNFRNYKRGDILVSLAGIAANLLLAGAFTLAVVLLIHLTQLLPVLSPTFQLLVRMARYGIVINLVLAFFNLIPIPPLDGSHVFYHLLSPSAGMRYRELGRYGLFILLGVMIFAPGVFSLLLWPVLALQGLAELFIRLWT